MRRDGGDGEVLQFLMLLRLDDVAVQAWMMLESALWLQPVVETAMLE